MGRFKSSAANLPPFSISRRLPAHERAIAKEHVRQIGEIIYSWNRMHAALFLVFWRLVFPDNIEAARDVWHLTQSDKTQRDMIAKAAIILKPGRLRTAIVWTVERADKLSPIRNAAAHVHMMFYDDGLVPNELSASARLIQRTENSPIRDCWRAVCGDLRALEQYAMDLHLALGSSQREHSQPLSKRPRLRFLPASPKKARPNKAPRVGHRQAPRRQP